MTSEMQPHEAARVVADNIKSRRKLLGLTQSELAERINAKRAKKDPKAYQESIAQIESGKTPPTITTLVEIATALEIPPDILLRDSSPVPTT